MKIQDLLRTVADAMDQETQSQMPNQAKMAVVDVDHSDGTDSATMFSPMQQELEMMKRAAGLPNAFDAEVGDCGCEGECGCDHEHVEPDAEMDDLRHMAGIRIA
jgi:hypothetical protein